MTRLLEEVGYPSAVDIRTEFSEILADIEAEMSSVLNERGGHARPLYEMLAYHLGVDGTGVPRGKRIRPLLGVLAYKSLTGDYRKALPGAAALELGHNFSLVHDDIEDSDAERHHRPTLWAIWGIPLAINAGDALFALSRLAIYPLMEGFSDHRVLELMKVYDETCLALCEGQYLDISFERRADVTVDAYMEMIGKKTAALIGGSVRAGAILATDDDTIAAAYDDFGYALGMAFQMADDVKGTFWSSTESGKAEAGDVRKRKKTLPMVWALENASDAPAQPAHRDLPRWRARDRWARAGAGRDGPAVGRRGCRGARDPRGRAARASRPSPRPGATGTGPSSSSRRSPARPTASGSSRSSFAR